MNEIELLTYLNLENSKPVINLNSYTQKIPPWEEGNPPEIKIYPNSRAADFLNVIDLRRSTRNLYNAITKNDLFKLLNLSLGRPFLRRYFRRYPTSGACDELGVLIIANKVEGIPRAAYWAHAENNELKWAADLNDKYLEFEIESCKHFGLTIDKAPSLTFLIFADWKRLEKKYQNCVLASALLDCGGMLQTMSIAAATIHLRACISGCIRPKLIQDWIGLDCKYFGHVGTICFGAR